MRTPLSLLALLVLGSVGPSRPAAAQPPAFARPPAAPAPHVPPSAPLEDERDPLVAPRLVVTGNLTLVGNVDTRADVSGSSVLDDRLQGDLSFGGAAWLDYPLAPFFSVGGGAGFMSWITEEESQSGFGRSSLVTISAHASLRLPLSELFEIYFRVPFGLSLDLAPDDWVDHGSLSPLPGWHAGGMLGMYLGGTRFGMIFEIGFVVHGLRSRIESDDGTEIGTFERKVKSAPMTLGLAWLF